MEDGILGLGEVGEAIQTFFPNAHIKDKKFENFSLPEVKFLHVCIPYQEGFEEIVAAEPGIKIIHSTVPVGTTQKIPNAVHSPIRGVHPNLDEGIGVFTKFVGADDKELGQKVAEHLSEAGMSVVLLNDSRTTELGKLLDTTYYGVCIEFHRYAKELCDKYGLNFERVMTDFNVSYNDGYTRLGMPNVVRPVLYPPKGDIGGHCVVQNTKYLPKMTFKGLWS